MGHDVHIRRIAEGDWDAIVALEAATYSAGALSEGRDALRSRARSSPATCFVLHYEQRPAGYLLALPYPMFRYPDLSRPEQVVHHSRNLHLHDLVVARHVRGNGLARELLHRLTATARAKKYERISLIAVGGSEGFWSANAFDAVPEVALAPGYGAGAVYMSTPVRRSEPVYPRKAK
ncbi:MULTISPECIES: GNAT family N-acetyltransferase [unclassified Embleya]|uniref:GNAT family N-acetyltransferase n=1 Tax=unclassified Embleya TaxID=2699296 RepID=UPI0036CA7486